MSTEENICWYHENLSRSDAEELLKREASGQDGAFLVRESSTAAGDFVLSVLHEGQVIHWQIRRHGEDAFFSIDECMIVHGLETLIEEYQKDGFGGRVQLQVAVPGTRPPHDSRRHGHTNLLHRATKEGNFTVVSELLKCGYRSLEAKNENGQTAVHLASAFGSNEILQKLVDHGANVNCRDKDGYTPLHYACQNDHIETVEFLVEVGLANVQIRNTETGWVPLHEAAYRGCTSIVETLLSFGAPLRPRTAKGETPALLAQSVGNSECVSILENYKCPEPKARKEDWYHGTLERSKAASMLLAQADKDGSFLIRYSERNDTDILTMTYNKEAYHFMVQRKGQFYFIDNGPLLNSLEHIVDHYTLMPDGLPTTLQTPIKPTPKPPLPPPFSEKFAMTLPSKHSKERRDASGRPDNMKRWLSHTSTLPLPVRNREKVHEMDSNMNTTRAVVPVTRPRKLLPISDNDCQSQPKEIVFEDLIPYDNLIMQEVLGEGAFGSVHKAIYQNKVGFEELVAVKRLHDDQIAEIRDQFLQEIKVMVGLSHHCIVRLIGLSQGASYVMVQELAPLGSMLKYLINHRQKINISNLKLWAWQVACGMQYLERQKRVHRDLAARNILLSSVNQAKVSDFGLSRHCNDRNYYTASQGGRWPIKWYAPESYNNARFTSASDVWSFGVTLWEMFSYGAMPYGDLPGHQAINLVEKGERLECPELCPGDIYRIMERCWAYNERDRPSFDQLVQLFTDTDYSNMQQLVTENDIS